MTGRWHPRLEAARLRLLRGTGPGDALARPYLAGGLYSMLPGGHRDTCPTVAVSERWVVYWNDRFVESCSMAELAATMYHELLHVLRRHHDRLRTYPLSVANVAADAEINDDLLREGFKLPAGCITPATIGALDNLLAEEYARLLQDRDVTGPAGGSGATGRPAPWEDAESDGLSVPESRMVARAVAQAVRQAGNVPGHLQRWADDILGPSRVDWRRELAAHVRRSVARVAGAADYSYRRPRRSQPVPDVVLPAPDCPVPAVAVVVDTSGSVSDEQLRTSLRELRGIIRALARDVMVLACDTDVHRVDRIVRAEQARDMLVGGGGTDMGVGIREAVARRADVVVVVTDGHTPWPDRPPAVPVVVVLHGDGEGPEWARVVRVP